MIGLIHAAFNNVNPAPPWSVIFSNERSENLDNSLWILSTILLCGCLIEEKTGCMSCSFKNSDQTGDVNCVPWSVTILEGFPYFWKWSFFNLLMKVFVLARLKGYNTTYLEKASIVDKIYWKPPFYAGSDP